MEEKTIYDIVIVGGGAIGLHICLELMEQPIMEEKKILMISAKGGSFCVAGGFIPPSSIFKSGSHAQKGSTIHYARSRKKNHLFKRCYTQVFVGNMDLDIVKNQCTKRPGTKKYPSILMNTNKFKELMIIEMQRKKINFITGKLISWEKEGNGVTCLNCKEVDKEFKIYGRRIYLCPGVGSLSLDLPNYIKNKIQKNDAYGGKVKIGNMEFWNKIGTLSKEVVLFNLFQYDWSKFVTEKKKGLIEKIDDSHHENFITENETSYITEKQIEGGNKDNIDIADKKDILINYLHMYPLLDEKTQEIFLWFNQGKIG